MNCDIADLGNAVHVVFNMAMPNMEINSGPTRVYAHLNVQKQGEETKQSSAEGHEFLLVRELVDW